MSFPKRSPWGEVHGAEGIGAGCWSVYTASHGGIWLTAEAAARIPKPFQPYHQVDGRHVQGVWYEEDCEWAIAYAFIPELTWPSGIAIEREAAVRAALERYYPEVLKHLAERKAVTS